ncbi:MAG: superoxide dismutase [Eubacteriales bacterium]|jgi:Fe-Mn family superoxide dismutase
MENSYYPFVNLPLPYDYSALEPYIDAKTMILHHDRHLQTYINNLNELLSENPRLQRLTLKELCSLDTGRLPYGLKTEIKNNAGGVYNHRLYFESLRKPTGTGPVGELARAIEQQFGDVARLFDELKKAGMSVFGSGYAWLVSERGRLGIMTTKNQDNPIGIKRGLCPVLTLDVWEHAYYLKHYNLRGDYIDDWSQVINWDRANSNYAECFK